MDSGSTGTKLTYEDYVDFPDDGRRHEILGGEHYVTPSPTPSHQAVSAELHFQLHAQVKQQRLGRVFAAPIDLQLSEHDIVVPDLVLVLANRERIVTSTKIRGIPDLVVEILSRSTRRHDRKLKKRLYERAGVPEFWIVDLAENQLEQYVLEHGSYRLLGRHRERVRFAGPADLVVDLREVW